jgi:hypothetical protein
MDAKRQHDAVCYDLKKKCQSTYLKKYEKKTSTSGDMKNFYRYASSRLKTRFNFPVLRNRYDQKALTSSDKANMLNDFFAGVYTVDDGLIPPIGFALDSCTTMPDFSVLTVYKLLLNMKNTYVAGPDGISATFCKTFAAELAFPLATLYEFSYSLGLVCRDWRDANVTALYKKNDKSNVENYRDISLVCNFSKPLEEIINQTIVDFCFQEQIFSPEQHAYLSGRSTTTNLLSGLYDWVNSVDNGYITDVIFLDIRKAFNSVPHKKLLRKLYAIGIRGKLYKWIKAFLTDRRQRVRVENSYSDFVSVPSGVPQGSTLGPTLFLLYINDLPMVVEHCRILMYADDVKVYLRMSNDADCRLLQEDLARIKEWTSTWQLSLAVDKCFFIRFSNRITDMPARYEIDGSVLSQETSTKDLGVIFSSNLKFHMHTDYVVTKALRMINLIRHNFVTDDPIILLRLYKTYVLSVLNYNSVIWNPCYAGDIAKLERCQKLMLRHIFQDEGFDYASCLRDLELPTLENQRKINDLIFMFKLVHNLTCLDPNDLVRFFESNYDTRGHKMKLINPRFRLTQMKHFFTCRTIPSWNMLDEVIIDSSTVDAFKRGVKKSYMGRG